MVQLHGFKIQRKVELIFSRSSTLNRNISLQILLVYLTSFFLGVDVACGNTENCNLTEHMAVSEMNSICFTLSFACHLNFP